MRVLIVIGGFFPGKKFGGPPVSVDNFCSLMKEYECFIITVNHDLFDTTPYNNVQTGWNDRGNSKVLYLKDSEYKKETFDKMMLELKPDVLYLQGLFQSCVLPCLQLAKKHNIPVLLAPRGELCAGALNLKKYKKIPYIESVKAMGLVKNIHWQSTSEEESEAIRLWMKAKESHIHALDNIPSIPKHDYPRRRKLPGEGRFVFLSRIHPKKNLLSAIRYFRAVEAKTIFDIYGAIEDEGYWKQCKQEIGTLPNNVTVDYCGLVTHEKVHEVFSRYDAFLFPTYSENYGHVIAEALIVGTPVIISDQTPWSDINETGAGWALPLIDESGFVNAIQSIIDKSQDEYGLMTFNAKEYIEKKIQLKNLKVQYTQCLSDIREG